MITGRTDRQTDRQTDRVRRNMRSPPREEGRIISIRDDIGDCVCPPGRRVRQTASGHVTITNNLSSSRAAALRCGWSRRLSAGLAQCAVAESRRQCIASVAEGERVRAQAIDLIIRY